MPLRGGWVVEPQAQLIYVDYNESDIDEPNGTRVRGASASGILTRLGVRTHRTFVREDGRKLQPYVTLNWWYSDTESHIAFNQVQLGSMYPRNRFEAKVGMNLALNKSWSGWTSVSGAWGQQDYYQYAVRVGVRYAW
ncbi:Outer membrane protein IcsA autotransporter precursor [compost metagenome]